jgi:hypothetical protein
VYRIDFMQDGQGQLSENMGASVKSIFLLLVISAFAISPAAPANRNQNKRQKPKKLQGNTTIHCAPCATAFLSSCRVGPFPSISI